MQLGTLVKPCMSHNVANGNELASHADFVVLERDTS